MGKYLNGINGPFIGKVGTAVGTTWKGIPVMRSSPVKRKKPFTEGELRQQARFRLINKFLSPLIDLFKQTFKQEAIRVTEYNKAISYNIKNAITGVYPDFTIDYESVLVGRGDLPGALSYALESPAPGQLKIAWTGNMGKGKARADDRTYAAIYIEEQGQWISDAIQHTSRASEGLTPDISNMAGNTLHVYLGFISADGREVSDSAYLGSIRI